MRFSSFDITIKCSKAKLGNLSCLSLVLKCSFYSGSERLFFNRGFYGQLTKISDQNVAHLFFLMFHVMLV